VQWKGVTHVSRGIVTGMTEEEAAKASRSDKPMLIYLYAEDPDAQEDPRNVVESDPAFTTSEKVAVGARFFDCLRIDAENAAEDRLLAEHVRKAPCLVYVRPTFEVVTVQTGKFNANRIFDAMCRTMKLDYDNCVKTAFKAQQDIGRERDKLQLMKDKLARIESDMADERSDAVRRRLDTERSELAAEIAAAEQELRTRENALYVLDPKDDGAQT